MSAPYLPSAEAARLAVLESYGILDTPAEPAFDDIVLLASRICATPVALVSLVAGDRQWFKARIGFEACQTPLAQSVCAHGLRAPGLLVIPDLTADPRTRENTLVTGPAAIRFYAGARLESPEGVGLGMLCVIDTQPRPDGLLPDQAEALQALARQAMTQIELRRAGAEKELLLQEAHHRVKNSLQMVHSLLMLQARSSTNKEAGDQLRASAGRVLAFGAMHESLYRAGAGVHVDLADYLGGLVADQNRALSATGEGRQVLLDAAPVDWLSSEASSIGIMAMELVTNALKYGDGQVTMTLRRDRAAIILAVRDEGRLLPADYDPLCGSGFGMRIVASMVRSRDGQLAVDRESVGTRFVITLPAPATTRTET